VNPLTGETLPSFIDGIVIGSELNGLEGSGTAFASTFFLENASDIDLSDEATLLIFTFEQPDGSQLVVQATITNGDGPTLQEFLDGYTLEELLASADTLNGAPYSYGSDNGGDNESTDGPDELVGDETDNFIQGLGGADVIEGLGGNDVLVGNAGSDPIWGGLGNDSIWAGPGDDSGDDVDAGPGNDIVGGGPGNDTLLGGDGDDTLFGGVGSDQLDGGTGADVIWGGSGNDVITGGDGDDTLGGGQGNDTINADAGDDIVYGGLGTGADDISGGDGEDTIYAGAGNDTIDGGVGNDLLFNGDGDDTVAGGSGDDTLWGAAGNDVLTGGDGADTFAFVAGNGADTISDFESGVDEVLFSGTGLSQDDLVFTDTAGGVEVSYGTDSLFFTGLTSADFSAGDFVFV
jgi:Ca2+-binding RTX toxin-like protein